MKKDNQSSHARLALFAAASTLALACANTDSAANGGDSGSTPGSSVGTGNAAQGSAPASDAGPSSVDAGRFSAGGLNDAGVVNADDGGANVQCALGDGYEPPLPTMISYISGVAVSTVAGSSIAGTQDGTGALAQFSNPTGIAIDTSGNLLVTDYDSARVRLVNPAGVVTTIAAANNFVDPFVAAVATDGSYYVGTDADDTGVKSATTGTVWRVTPLGGGALATPVVVGQGFGRCRGLAPSAGGDLFVVDRTQDVVDQLMDTSGEVSLIAGAAGLACYRDGTGASAQFNSAVGAAAMPDGSFVVADGGNNRIRRVTAAGVVTTLAGVGVASMVDGPCTSAAFNAPRAVAADSAGNVYVSDIGNHVIRRISAACTVETAAGDGTAGFNDGVGTDAEFYGQEGIAVTPDGATVYVADGNGGDGSAYHRVRALTIP